MKVLWSNGMGYWLDYDKTELAKLNFKFVCYEIHEKVFLFVGRSNAADHKELSKLALGYFSEFYPIIAAGSSQNGKIDSWESIGLNVWTPKQRRAKILEALGLVDIKD